MKNNLFKPGLSCLLLLVLLIMGAIDKIYAQPTINSASLADTATCKGEAYQNSALMDYTPNCGSCSPGQLKAVVTDDFYSTPSCGLSVGDGVNPAHCFSFSGQNPDVAICNDGSSSTYFVCVVYALNVNNSGCISNCIKMDVYSVVGAGTGSFNVSLAATKLITKQIGENARVPHIDVIAEYGSLTGPGSWALCDKVVIGWTDINQTVCGVGKCHC